MIDPEPDVDKKTKVPPTPMFAYPFRFVALFGVWVVNDDHDVSLLFVCCCFLFVDCRVQAKLLDKDVEVDEMVAVHVLSVRDSWKDDKATVLFQSDEVKGVTLYVIVHFIAVTLHVIVHFTAVIVYFDVNVCLLLSSKYILTSLFYISRSSWGVVVRVCVFAGQEWEDIKKAHRTPGGLLKYCAENGSRRELGYVHMHKGYMRRLNKMTKKAQRDTSRLQKPTGRKRTAAEQKTKKAKKKRKKTSDVGTDDSDVEEDKSESEESASEGGGEENAEENEDGTEDDDEGEEDDDQVSHSTKKGSSKGGRGRGGAGKKGKK